LVYPNPSTGEVWFKITNTSESPTNIAVYSLEGTLLHSEVPLNDKINFNFSSGIYFVEVNTLSESYREKVSIIK